MNGSEFMASHDDEAIQAIKQRKMIELQKIAATKSSMSNIKGPIILTDSNFTSEVSKYPIILVDFWAPWCGPCRIVSPIIEQLANEYAGTVVFGKLNIDENQMVATSFGIQSIPTMMILKNGRVVDVLVGALPRGQIQMKLKQHLIGSTNSVSNMYG
jgi:thioredoxin 1